jgi:hypothetical protein
MICLIWNRKLELSRVPGHWHVWIFIGTLGCWHVWIVTGTFGCWHVWIVNGTLVLTCLNCYRYLGADIPELLQVLTCLKCCRFLGADMSELLQVPGCWHVWIVTGTWMLTCLKCYRYLDADICTAAQHWRVHVYCTPHGSCVHPAHSLARLVPCIWVNSVNTSRRIFKCNEIVKSCWVLWQLC